MKEKIALLGKHLNQDIVFLVIVFINKNKQIIFTCYFLLEMSKVNCQKDLFGIKKWHFARLGDIDLVCEVTIFSSCLMSGQCRLCRRHLKWCLEILQERWNYIDYIDFYSALEVIKNNRTLFNDSSRFVFWRKNQIRKLISRK